MIRIDAPAAKSLCEITEKKADGTTKQLKKIKSTGSPYLILQKDGN